MPLFYCSQLARCSFKKKNRQNGIDWHPNSHVNIPSYFSHLYTYKNSTREEITRIKFVFNWKSRTEKHDRIASVVEYQTPRILVKRAISAWPRIGADCWRGWNYDRRRLSWSGSRAGFARNLEIRRARRKCEGRILGFWARSRGTSVTR